MAITRDFKETIKARALMDPIFRRGLLAEGMECFLSGEIAVGKSLIRDYIKATIGFEALAAKTSKSPKSLMRMFGAEGNPTISNLFAVLSTLQKEEKMQLHITSRGNAS